MAVRENGENFSANILWHQAGEGFEIDLWGPLGQGRVQLVKKGAEIQLRDGRGEILSKGSPDVMMRQQLGWSLPVEVLPAWIQGQPLETIEARTSLETTPGAFRPFSSSTGMWRSIATRLWAASP